MEAWLLSWSGTQPGKPKNKILYILDASKSPEEVAEIVQILHNLFICNLAELADYSQPGAHIPYQSQLQETPPGYTSIYCGHNPHIDARLVRNLEVTEDSDGIETIAWEERRASGEWGKESLKQHNSKALLDQID